MVNRPDSSNKPRDRRRAQRSRLIPGRLHWRAQLRERWHRWLDRRLPPAREVRLNQKSIFIFPTRAGMAFLGFCFLLLLIAINFENSAVFALTFLLTGLFVVSILHTFSNLSGIVVSASHAETTFAGMDATFHIVLTRQGARRYFGLQLFWPGNTPILVDLADQREARLGLLYRTGRRGVCTPGRLKIETCYPLGLLRAWTWVDLKAQTLAYPYPVASEAMPKTSVLAHERGNNEEYGSDDFYGLRDYVPGDTLRAVAWKNYAKTGALNTKQFIDPVDHRLWLDWEQTYAESAEARLEQLCYWALEAEKGHSEYGLRLPNETIEPGRHQHHLDKVLRALALYEPARSEQPEEQQGWLPPWISSATESGGVP